VHRPDRRTSIVSLATAALTIGIAALSVWEGRLSRNSSGAHWSVALVVLAGLGAAIVLGHGRQHLTARQWVAQNLHFIGTWRSQPRRSVLSATAWAVLIAGLAGWDAVSFVFQSAKLPTLSYYIGHVTRYPLGRGLLFALWLAAGVYLVSARRAAKPR
jgi:hypothetical protein